MPASQQARTDRIAAALAANPTETDRVTFRGKTELLPVIRLELADTVLNHRSHRIRAQLEGHPSAETIKQNPEDDAAQDAIRDLLRSTPGFQPLMQDVGARGQAQPGVITVSGLLINANTRAVALGDLGQKHIDVAVLPADATIPELYALEADLQVAADFRQDYTFTNELLFVYDLITEQNRSETDVALQMRWGTPGKQASINKGVEQVRRYTRYLAFIREIQALSGGQVPLVDFDNAAQTLQEFDTRYEAQRVKDPDGAADMKSAQILALLADLGYQSSREIKPGWVDKHLEEALVDNELLKEVLEATAEGDTSSDGDAPEGLEILDGLEDDAGQPTASPARRTVATLVDRLGKSAQAKEVTLPTADGEKTLSRQNVLDAVQDAMKAAAESAKEAATQGDAVKAGANHCRDAAKRLNKASDAWAAAHQAPAFDDAAFEAAFRQAERALAALKQQTDL